MTRRAAVAVYFSRPMLILFALGFSSGLPLALTGGTLDVWLKEAGLSLETIGYAAAIGLPYLFKFLWAPLADRMPLPGFTSLLGQRRGWILASQLALAAAIFGMGRADPAIDLWLTVGFALAVATLSATQDIVIDAFRIESLSANEQAAGAAVATYGYRIGMLASGAGALFLSDAGLGWGWSWGRVYAGMASCLLIGMAAVLAAREPDVDPPLLPRGRWLRGLVFDPFADFWRRHGRAALAILAFAALYKLGNNLADKMTNPFLLELGFTKADIAGVTKFFGLAPTLAGLAAGGVLMAATGQFRALLICGLVQPASLLGFAVLAVVGKATGGLSLLAGVVALEHFTFGMGTSVFLAFLSARCTPGFAASQYALLSALTAAARTVFVTQAGVLAHDLGWRDFFLLSAAAAAPGLVLLLALRRRIEAEQPDAEPPGAKQANPGL